jgi:hypothetical protein
VDKCEEDFSFLFSVWTVEDFLLQEKQKSIPQRLITTINTAVWTIFGRIASSFPSTSSGQVQDLVNRVLPVYITLNAGFRNTAGTARRKNDLTLHKSVQK